MAYARDAKGMENGHHQTSAYALGVLWIVCVIFWITKLAKLRIIQIQRLKPIEPGAPVGSV
jgi:hypothetical protein